MGSTAKSQRESDFKQEADYVQRQLSQAQAVIQLLQTQRANYNDQHLILFESDQVIKLFVDPESGRILDANPAACRLFGYTKKAFLSKKIDDIDVLPENITSDDLHNLHTQQRLFSERQYLVDGEIHNFEVYFGSIQMNGKGVLYAIAHDVTTDETEITERRLLSQVVDQSINSIMITDPLGNIKYVNHRFSEVTGYSVAEVQGQNPRFLKSSHTSSEEYANLWTTIQSGHEWSGEFLNKKKNGELFWQRTSIVPVKHENGQITHFVSIGEDITEQKRAWDTLKQKETSLKRSQAIAQVGDWTWDENSNVVHCSDELYRIFGLDPATIEGDVMSAMWAAIHPDDRNIVFNTNEMIVSEGKTGTIEFRVVWPDGSIRHIWAQLGERVQNAYGDFVSLFGVVQDITERKQIEIQLQEAERFARSTVNALSSQIAILEEDGTIIAVNDAWRTFAHAYSVENRADQLCEGSNFLHVLQAVDPKSENAATARAVLGGIDQVLHRKTEEFLHEYVYDIAHEQRWFSVRITRFSGNGPARIVIAHVDINERKLAEKAAEEQRALAVALRETITILTSTLEPEQVMYHILNTIGLVVPHSAVNIMVIEGTTVARVSHCRGYSTQEEIDIRAAEYSLETSFFAQMLSSHQPIKIDYCEGQLGWRLDSASPHSHLGAPILISGQVLGFIILDSDVPNGFTELHVDRLKIFAEQAAIAIQNAQMYEGIARTAEQLAKVHRATEILFTQFSNSHTLEDIGAQVASAVISNFGLVDAGVILIDPDQNQLIRLQRSGPNSLRTPQHLYRDGPGLVPKAIRNGQTVYAPDVSTEPDYIATFPETRSELVIPLFASEQIIGVLDIQSPRGQAFSASDQRALHAVAQHAATAIENIRLYEAIQRNAQELRKRVDERTAQLRRMNDRVTTILNNTSDSIVLVDTNNRIENTNLSFDRTFDYEHDSLFGEAIQVLVDTDQHEKLLAVLEKVRQTGQPQRLEMAMRTKFGKEFDSDLAVAYVDGNEGHVVCSIRDITHLKEVERVKDQFVSMVSHELRTPISSIMLSSSSINKYFDRMTREQKLRKLETIYLQAATLTDLVTSILDVSRLDARQGKRGQDRVDVALALGEAISELAGHANEKHQTLDMETFNNMWTIDGEHLDMMRIWRNLLSNAVKYTDEGGTIKAMLYGASQDNTSVYQKPDLTRFGDQVPEGLILSEHIIGIVKDNGHGIRPEDMPKLFTRFFRGWATATSITGTGLGLSLVRDLLHLYGGDIAVCSELGVGTTFCFWLPISDTKGNIYDNGSRS